MVTAAHLAFKEIWRNRGRFALFSMVIALITVLVLFVAALSEGLGAGNREYLQKLNGELIVFHDTAQLNIGSSRIERNQLTAMRVVEGVQDVGPVGFSSAEIPYNGGADALKIALIGLEPGKPGEPPVEEGRPLTARGSNETIIDRTVALVTGLKVGDEMTIRSTLGNSVEFYKLTVVGITDSRKYGIRPSILVPDYTWDQVKPQSMAPTNGMLAYNIVVVKLTDPTQIEAMRQKLEAQVPRVEVVDRKTAYENTPGYREQQSTLQTQNLFALLIGLLVIGGFFQIQTLQKVNQIGMLKAIGTPDRIIVIASMLQIVMITVFGVLVGSLVSLGLSLGFPANIPIIFTPGSVAVAIGSILLIGPLGGLVSIRYSLRVEPLTALGLSQ